LSRVSIPTGLALLLTGLIALQASMTSASAVGDPVNTTVVSEPLLIEGLDPSVVRALQVDGSAQVLTDDEMANLPPAVTRILIEHGAALTVEYQSR